jgi:POTRA domain, FtsQ-type
LLYAWGRQADAFAIEKVRVQGGWRISDQRAARLLRAEFLGRNLFTVTTADVRAALDPLSYLATVEVDRDFPTTLRVRLVEYRPAAYVYAKGRWFLLADGGHVIREVGALGKIATEQSSAATADRAAAAPSPSGSLSASPSASPRPLPATSSGDAAAAVASPTATPAAAADGSATGAGDQDADAAEAEAAAARSAALAATLRSGPPSMRPRLPRLTAAAVPAVGELIADDGVLLGLRVLEGLPSTLRSRVAVVRVLPGGQVTLLFDRGLYVEFGGEDRLVAKALALRAVLAAYRVDGTTPTYIDVSAPDRPLGRPRLSS